MSPVPHMTKASRLALRERNRKALRLRATGMTYNQIAAECAYLTPDAARKAVGRLLARVDTEDARAARAIHRERLDWLLRALWLAATNPGMALQAARQNAQPLPPDQIAAVHAILRLMVEQAKVEGLYAPTKAEVSGPGGGPVEARVERVLRPDEQWMREYVRAWREVYGSDDEPLPDPEA